jgi:outer membrane receptor for ferric coprogen and ferric-rhodotorulic acid
VVVFTTGGAINFIAARPTQAFISHVDVNYGNYNLMDVEARTLGVDFRYMY